MAYGSVCFATLLSFVGTVLGGIWADQSWGRFWGWDPKENGAALIVLWNAIILHARWGGYIRERGLMVMAVFGNVITAWSFFGTNLLGVGLHSYGFTNNGFYWLMAFFVSQFVVMLLAAIPIRMWRSSPATA
jgi:ABC-type transport system involved in cytochrome c biogenesis permease subunit